MYVIYDRINFWYDKSPNFVELMLKSWIFSWNQCINDEDNQVHFVNYNSTFQRFGKK
jgi:hypothetical protein